MMYSVYTSDVNKKHYHHGDLRRALLGHARKQLLRQGPEGVSLREAARAAGVSPRAPYRHFPDREALLAALAEESFQLFGAALQGCEGLEALAGAYVSFALENPRRVQLMFGDYFPDRARRFPALHQAALATFAVLQQQVPGGSAKNAAVAWALVHGLSELRKEQFQHVLPSARGLQRHAVDVFLHGALKS
jgi:AcrR family transcriptional regulator